MKVFGDRLKIVSDKKLSGTVSAMNFTFIKFQKIPSKATGKKEDIYD